MHDYDSVNEFIKKVEDSMRVRPAKAAQAKYVGVDLGTAFTVIVVLDEEKNPLGLRMQFANVIKDGLVVDFAGAARIVRNLKAELEDELDTTLANAAIAVPPGTGIKDGESHRYVVESAGFNVTNILDEPTAANAVLRVQNGVIVDIGGGTTGLSVLKDGKVVYTADEPTGGTHVSLVLAGHNKITFEEAELLKRDASKQREFFPVVVPVFQKMASIINQHIKGFDVDEIYLVGGTCCMEGIEGVIERETGIHTSKPHNPLLVTPSGIALNC